MREREEKKHRDVSTCWPWQTFQWASASLSQCPISILINITDRAAFVAKNSTRTNDVDVYKYIKPESAIGERDDRLSICAHSIDFSLALLVRTQFMRRRRDNGKSQYSLEPSIDIIRYGSSWQSAEQRDCGFRRQSERFCSFSFNLN